MDRFGLQTNKYNIRFIRHALLHNNPYNYDSIFLKEQILQKKTSIAFANSPLPPNASNLQYYNVLLCMIWIFTQSQTPNKGISYRNISKIRKKSCLILFVLED